MSSMLDFLLGAGSHFPSTSPYTSLLRDLEALLNTRSDGETNVSERFQELKCSLYTYGLSDLTAFDPDRAADRRRMQHTLAHTIAAFEPRLKHVHVHEPTLELNRTLRFSVEAVFQTECQPEPVHFDTVLRLDTNTYAVKGQH